jgi:hypothetical protein
MAKILGNFHLALLIGVVLLLAAMFGLHGALIGDGRLRLDAVHALPARPSPASCGSASFIISTSSRSRPCPRCRPS